MRISDWSSDVCSSDLAGAGEDRERAAKTSAILALAGAVNLPIIRYSVVWWNTLHQGSSITLSGSSIDSSILWPLPLTALGFSLLFAAFVLMRMRADLARTRVEARLRRLAAAACTTGRSSSHIMRSPSAETERHSTRLNSSH